MIDRLHSITPGFAAFDPKAGLRAIEKELNIAKELQSAIVSPTVIASSKPEELPKSVNGLTAIANVVKTSSSVRM